MDYGEDYDGEDYDGDKEHGGSYKITWQWL